MSTKVWVLLEVYGTNLQAVYTTMYADKETAVAGFKESIESYQDYRDAAEDAARDADEIAKALKSNLFVHDDGFIRLEEDDIVPGPTKESK